MEDQDKSKDTLIVELVQMRQSVFELEGSLTVLERRGDAGQEAEATSKAMIEAFDGLIYVCSPNYDVEFMNERFIQRTGHNPTGEKCYEAIHNLKEACPWCVNERVQNGETVRWEVQSPKDSRWYYVVNTPVRHRDGTISKMAVIQDVTERKQAEDMLKRAKDELEIRVHERTVELESSIHLLKEEISARKQAEEALTESEARVRMKLDSIISPECDVGTLELADVIDAGEIQAIMDDFYGLTNIGVAILDLKGKVLVATGWQEICTKFHRVHPETSQNCIDSDTQLSSGIDEGAFRLYRCMNNMWDIATPIIVGGQHLGNLFLGQFLFEEESPDYETFRAQAQQYGFDEQEYLAALDRAPRWSRETVDKAMRFYAKMTRILSRLSFGNIKLSRSIAEREHLVNSLRESEQRYRLLAENTLDVIWQTDLDLRFTYVNPAIAQVTGYTVDEWIRTKLTEHCDEENFMKMAQAASEEISRGANSAGTILDAVILKKNKEPISVEIRGRVILGENGLPIAVQGVARDISDRKRAEEAMLRLNRELRAISTCNQILLRAVDEQTLLNEICRIICDEAGYRLAWVGYAENNDAKTIRPVAWAGFDSGYIAKAKLTWADDTERGWGPAGKAIRSGETICVQDFTTDPRMTPWRKSALRRGYHSGIALPLKDESTRVFGVLLVYHSEPNAVTPSEIQLMEELAGDLAFGINTLRARSERKRAEQALRESEQQYRAVFDNAGIGINIVDRNTRRVTQANPALLNMLGYSEEELQQLTHLDITYPEDREITNQHVDSLMEGTLDSFEFDKRYIKKDGSIVWGHLSVSAIRDAEGNPRAAVGMIADITERKKAEDAIRKSEERLELALDGADIGLWDWNLKTGEAVWSERSIRRLGYFPGELQTNLRTWKKLIHPDDWPHVSKVLNGHLEGSIPFLEVEYRFRAKSGEWKWILARGKIVECDEQGKPSRLIGTSLEVTERKSAELERAELKAQLLQAQKMEAIGTLAGGIAHDFNNLLTVILGYSDLIISDRKESDKDYEDLKKVIHAARTAGDMVQQILAFSRKTETKPRPINLNKQVEQLKKMLSRLIPKTIEVEISLDSGLPTVNADPAQIEQVLMNLAVNARDAMPNGGTLLIETQTVLLDERYCRFHVEASKGPHALLVVKDTGVGIDNASMDRIFEPFYTTKKTGQGTGLGLAMVYGIVRNHGGHITCESELGRGTAFKIYLPAHEVEGATDVSTSGEFSALGTGTILLADDEEFVRQLGQRILEKGGYTVITATNGQEAVDVYKETGSQISLVILDLIMPVMDGIQSLEEILKLDPRAKVLIASGYSADDRTQKTLETGGKGFVNKPYNIKLMLRAVRDALDSDQDA